MASETWDEAKAFKQAFSTPSGKRVLEVLRSYCEPDNLVGHTTHDTYFSLGQRDVLKLIEFKLREGEKIERRGTVPS